MAKFVDMRGQEFDVAAHQLLYTIEQCIAITASSRNTLYREMKQGRLRFLKLGAGTRISRKALHEWIAAREAMVAGAA